MIIPIAHVAAHTPPSVTLACRSPHPFRVVPLGGATRWFRESGYVEPILSGDRAFDERWAVESDDREFVAALVQEREARGVIGRLWALGSGVLEHSGSKLTVVLSSHKGEQQEREKREQEIRGQLEALDRIIARLCSHRTFPHHGGGARVAIALVLLALALTAGLAGLALFADELLVGELGRLTLKSLLVSLPGAAVLCFAMARLLAGRSRSHRDLGLVALFALLALPVLGVGVALTINRLADGGPPTVRLLPVLEVLHKRGEENHVSHYAVVPDWREGAGPTRRIQIGRALADRAVAGQSRLRLTTSPGALGAERELDLQLETDTAAR